MYCKRCNINVKKDRKVCPHCGTALVPGEVKGDKTSRMRRIVIMASAVALVVIAFFLTIFMIGRVPPELHGKWYETQGYGYAEFKPNGVVIFTASSEESTGTYTFNSATDEGTIVLNDMERALSCDGTTLNWGGSIMTKTYVEQIEYDFDSIFGGLAG